MSRRAFALSARWALPSMLLLALLPRAVRAQGSPPLLTNDTGVVGAGAVEFNLGWAHVRGQTARETELPIFDVAYGLNATMEVSYAVAWVSARATGTARESGLGNSTLGFKWNLHDGGGAGPSWSVSPQLEFNNPGSTSERRGLADEGATLVLPFQWQRSFGGWTVSLDAGRVFHFLRADEWYAGAALGGDVNESFAFGVELYLETSRRFDRSALHANIGASWKLSERYSLLFALGRDLHRHDGEAARFRSYVGWQIRR